ncbi:MAG: hypothetical protein IAE78_28660 [Myxococcus sp.]|nr:hypothetical protein [Myxococcus sp.]
MGLAEKRWGLERKKTDSYGLPNLIKAFKEITVDDLGKEAVEGALKKVIVKPRPLTGRASGSRTAWCR